MCEALAWPRGECAPPEQVGRTGDARWVGHVVVLALCAGALAAAFLLHAGAEGLSFLGYRWPFECWLNSTFGLRCALCGMSRSFCCLAHGDVAKSFAFHPLGPIVFGLVCVEVLYRLYPLLAGPAAQTPKLVRAHLILVAAVSAALFVHWLVYLGGLIL